MPSFLPDLIALLQRVHELSLTDAELATRLGALTGHLSTPPPEPERFAPAEPRPTPASPPEPTEPAPDPALIGRLAEHFRTGGAVAAPPQETRLLRFNRVPGESGAWIKRLEGKERLATWLVRREDLRETEPARVATGDVERRREAVALGGDIVRLLDEAPDHPSADERAAYRLYAGNCKATARAVDLIARQLDTTDDEAGLLLLLAESLSALRQAAHAALGGREDADQDAIFSWLKRHTSEARVFVRRHMRLDDPADVDAWADRLRRIDAFAGEPVSADPDDETHRRLFKKLRYHLKLIGRTPTADHDHDWGKVLDSVTELVQSGLPPSHAGLRDELLAVLDFWPERELSPEVSRVLREIDRYLESRADEEPDEGDSDWPERTGVVAEAAALLQGRAAVLIGGTRRAHAADSLEAAFGLSELIWITTREHQSHTAFETAIARPDVAVVLLAIRWASHGFGEVKAYCDLYGKPLVRLKAGYNPNQVAVHLIEQASGRLGGG